MKIQGKTDPFEFLDTYVMDLDAELMKLQYDHNEATHKYDKKMFEMERNYNRVNDKYNEHTRIFDKATYQLNDDYERVCGEYNEKLFIITQQQLLLDIEREVLTND